MLYLCTKYGANATGAGGRGFRDALLANVNAGGETSYTRAVKPFFTFLCGHSLLVGNPFDFKSGYRNERGQAKSDCTTLT